MNKEWNTPELTDLSVVATEAAIKHQPELDGETYEVAGWGTVELHKS